MVSLAPARPHPGHSSGPSLPAPALAQLRVYYMMSRVNQGSINAKSAAGLTYQTQLPMLNTQPRQQPGQEQRNSNEALCGGWARPAEGWCAWGLTGVRIDGGERGRAGPAVCSAFPGLHKSFSQTQSAESPSPQIPARTGPAAGAVSRPALLEENAGRAGHILGRLPASWDPSSPTDLT